jgi:hypothetical protein
MASPDAGPPPGSPVALVHIGPDVSVESLCANSVETAIASVSNLGSDTVISWTAEISGNQAFSTPPIQMDLGAGQVGVAAVIFQPPLTAAPGDIFHAVATISALDGSFPEGTVDLLGRVVAGKLTAGATSIDFGDLAAGAFASRDVTFRNDSQQPVVIVAPPSTPPFTYTDPGTRLGVGQSISLTVSVYGTPGDYTATPVWRALVRDDLPLPEACGGDTTLAVHVHIHVDADAAVD